MRRDFLPHLARDFTGRSMTFVLYVHVWCILYVLYIAQKRRPSPPRQRYCTPHTALTRYIRWLCCPTLRRCFPSTLRTCPTSSEASRTYPHFRPAHLIRTKRVASSWRHQAPTRLLAHRADSRWGIPVSLSLSAWAPRARIEAYAGSGGRVVFRRPRRPRHHMRLVTCLAAAATASTTSRELREAHPLARPCPP